MMQLPTKGSLAETNFIDILKECGQAEFTGMVRLEHASLIKVVYFQKGTIAFASSSEKSDRLTEVLKNAGKLTPEQVEDAQARLRPNVSLGKTLVELGYISARDLLWGARAQVEGILQKLLFWTQGSYQILEGPLPREIIGLNLSVPQIIFDGILKSQDRQWVLQNIGSPQAVYVLSPEFHEKYIVYKLPADAIVTRIDGKRSLDEIAHQAGKDLFDTCKTIVALNVLGLAERLPEQRLISPPEEVAEPQPGPTAEPKEEEAALGSNLSLGQVLQLPTVEELQREPEPRVRIEPERGAETEEKAEPVSPLPPEPSPTPAQERQVVSLTSSPTTPAPEFPVFITRHRAVADWRRILIMLAAVLAMAGTVAVYYFYQMRRAPETITVKSLPPAREPAPKEHASTEESRTSVVPAGVPSQKQEVSTKSVTPEKSVPVLEGPTALIKAGRMEEAASNWKQNLLREKEKFTIQLAIACQEKTVTDTFKLLDYSKEVSIVPIDFKGRPCFRILFGLFSSEPAAQIARAGLPSQLLQQPSPPQVVPLTKVLR